MSDSESVSDLCVEFSETVRWRQHGISCDECDRWTHRTCNKGLWQAIRHVLPESSLKGCSFHWAYSIQRHVQDFGLARSYQERTSVHQVISKLLALPFLPGRDIKRAFTRLKDRADTSSQTLRDLFAYVEDAWVDSNLWSVDEWSVYRQPIRTNNDTEGWHRKLNQKSGNGSLSFYVLIPMLLDEAKFTDIQVHLVSLGELIRNRRATFRSMDNKIELLWDQYDEHEIVCEDFLQQVGDIYG